VSLGDREVLLRLGALALLAAAPARANVTGLAEVQGQATQSVFHPYGGRATSSVTSLLLESLSLHYAGLPFGPAVAVTTLGGSFTNVNTWQGSALSGTAQVLSFDTSIGFLPRRAVPLRLYASGSLAGGANGQLATRGAGPSVLYGGALNLEPGTWLPGFRLDASEGRTSRPGQPDLSDAQRRLVASAYETIGGQRLVLGARLETDHREGAGDVTSRGTTLDWSSSRHQTTLFASEVRRSVPFLSGISSDRAFGGQSEQRWAPILSTQLGARLAEASGSGASGEFADARAGFAWRPIQAGQQLTLSGSFFGGRTRTTSPTASASGSSYGAGGRAGYGRPLGPLSANLSLGADTSSCNCAFGNDGTSTVLDAAASLALLTDARGSAQLAYTVARAFAPLARGGDRFENHARAYGRVALGQLTELNGSLAYDDQLRELVDITAGRALQVHERALTAALGGSTRLGAATCSADVRHARSAVATERGSPFVAGRPTMVHSLTSGQAGLSWSPYDRLGLQAQALASHTDLQDAPDIASFGANAQLTWRTGRLLASLQYQLLSTRMSGQPSSFQQTVRAVLSRPFEF